MRRLRLGRAIALVPVVLILVLVGCAGSETAQNQLRFPEPYVTKSQVSRIRVGMSAKSAVALLGARAADRNNPVGPWPLWRYPIIGTGTGDAYGEEEVTYRWFFLCMKAGRVTGTVEAHLGSLPRSFCSGH